MAKVKGSAKSVHYFRNKKDEYCAKSLVIQQKWHRFYNIRMPVERLWVGCCIIEE